MNDLKARGMQKEDLCVVVNLLADDDLGQQREHNVGAVHADYINSWSSTNPSNTIHSGTQAARDSNQWLSSQFLEDGSYTTLRSASLTYNLKNILSDVGIDQLKVFVNAENLFLSKFFLISPILPSIMSDGEITSHPICACNKDCLINTFTVSSFNILPLFKRPSWP